MNPTRAVWYVLGALAALTPVGLRAVTWERGGAAPPDPVAVQSGEALFHHQWTPRDPLAAGGDGLGPVFNATSCLFCHSQARPGGGGEVEQNVLAFSVRSGPNLESLREGVVHAAGGETLADVHPELPAVSRVSLDQLPRAAGAPAGSNVLRLPRGVRLSQLNTPALFGAGLIDAIPDRELVALERAQRLRNALAPAGSEALPVGRVARLADGRVGRFGWKAQSPSLASFVQAACANELGLGNPGQAQPAPLKWPGYRPPGLDLTAEQCDQLTAFVAALPRPLERRPTDLAELDRAEAGKRLFHAAGCAACHVPDVGGVEGLYSDLLLHRMGADLEGSGAYYDVPLPPVAGSGPEADGPASPGEWRTPPLWGVADSAPYLHDGRAATLEEAIRQHAGQGAGSAQRFAGMSAAERGELVAFLKTLRAP